MIDKLPISPLRFEELSGWVFIVGVIIYLTYRTIKDYMSTKQSKTSIARMVMLEDIVRGQSKIFEQLTKFMEIQAGLAIMETSPTVIMDLLHARLDGDVLRLLKETENIISINHIIDKEATKSKVESAVLATYNNTRSKLDSPLYKGKRASCFMSKKFIPIIRDVIIDYVYREDRSHEMFILQLQRSMEDVRYDFYSHMQDALQ